MMQRNCLINKKLIAIVCFVVYGILCYALNYQYVHNQKDKPQEGNNNTHSCSDICKLRVYSNTAPEGKVTGACQTHQQPPRARATRLDTKHWGVPLYVLTLGGKRFEQFKKECKLSIIRLPWYLNQKSIQSDYPHIKNKGVLGCTRAHLSFAQNC